MVRNLLKCRDEKLLPDSPQRPTVDGQDGAGDVPGVQGAQEGDGGSDLGRAAQAASGDRREVSLTGGVGIRRVLPDLLGARRVDLARRDRVHGDAEWADLLR